MLMRQAKGGIAQADTSLLTAQAILDFSQDLDLGLLDRVVAAMYTGAGNDVSSAALRG